jgi:hypothetical protein
MVGNDTRSSKFRFFFLLIVLLLSSVFIYQIALKVTFNLMGENTKLADKLENLVNTKEAKSFEEYDPYQRYFLPNDSSLFFKSNLFSEVEKISTHCNLEIIKYYSMSDFVLTTGYVATQKAELSGDYVSLLKALQLIEKVDLRFKLNSIRFFTTKSIQTKSDELVLELYFQVVVKN